MLVVAVGDEHEHVPPLERTAEGGALFQAVQDGGSTVRPDVGDGLGDRRAVIGRPRHRSQRFRERRDDNLVLGTEFARERCRGFAHEVHPPAHALAAIDEQRVGGWQLFGVDDIEHLRNVVLKYRELGRWNTGDEPPEPVLHGRVDEHARHLGALDHLVRFQEDDVSRGAPQRVPRLRRNLAWFERIVVRPLNRPRRTLPRFAEEHVVDEEPDAARPRIEARR